MKLTKFSATNYRSITSAHSITLSGVTVLIGKNNEGKSNLLKSLQVAMLLLQRHSASEKRRLNYSEFSSPYIWSRDFPIQYQSRKSSTQTILRLEFELDDDECIDFKSTIGTSLNGLLLLEIKIGKDHDPQIRVVKTGKGTKSLATKSVGIANFIANRIRFNYIPAVRTEAMTIDLIRDLLSSELRELESNQLYLEALAKISELQQPILSDLEERVFGPLKEFLPNLKSVKLEISDSSRRYSLRQDVNVIVDDGTPTKIEFKGDGVKSLAALGLLKNRNYGGGVSVLAIEEPESHLHPGAIHQVNQIIRQIAETTQVIITTHNPLLVDREHIKSNIIVSDGAASQAKNISSIREVLGIKASDNLTNANFSLVVEGETDLLVMKAVLPTLSEKIAKALRDNLLVIIPTGGTGKLSYRLNLLRNSLCATHTILDSDRSGIQAYKLAEKDGLVSPLTCTLISCEGMRESELEDCIDPLIYKDALLSEFGINLSSNKFKGVHKWSDRVDKVCIDQGKLLDGELLLQIKYSVARSVEKNPKIALLPKYKGAIDSLVDALEGLLRV